jgi:hypothetical protein
MKSVLTVLIHDEEVFPAGHEEFQQARTSAYRGKTVGLVFLPRIV